ncbi:MAG: aminoacyl-tRNA deacylase [Candidatus Nanoarchaeia archaeon]|nr:aminoacyl-tRNA deacylase [Candidatus Nanoarchaeia archaeon]
MDVKLEDYLKKNNIWYRFIEKPETIHTSDAAEKACVKLEKVTKSLILLDENKNAVLAIIPGDKKLSFSKLKNAVKSKKVRMVAFEDAEKYSGYLPGATPMVFHKLKMKVVVDKKLTQYESIYGGGGTRLKLLELKVEDVIKLNQAIVDDITE